MSKEIKVGLIGFGMAGRVFHAPTIVSVPNLKLAKIRETKAEHINIIKSRYPDAAIVNDTKDILNDPDIDVVVVATPNATHFAIAKEALQAGKDVVVDKPFTVTSGEADELIALAKQKGKMLTVYHNRRWDGDFKTVKKVIESKILGTLAECEIHYDRFRNFVRPNTWKEEGETGTGLLYDLGSHLIDQVQVLFGLPKSIMGDLRAQRPGSKIVDNFELVLNYDQLKVTLKSGMLIKEPLPRYILLGHMGTFVKYGMDVQEEALIAGLLPSQVSNWGDDPETLWGTVHTEWNGLQWRGKVKSESGNYPGFYDNVYKSLVGEASLAVLPEQARNTIKIIELAIKSSEEKRTLDFQ